MRAITLSTGSRPDLMGFNATNICARLRWPPPVNAVTFSTAGSAMTMAMKLSSFSFIAWNEIDWSARMKPIMRPVSCCGKNPFGTTV